MPKHTATHGERRQVLVENDHAMMDVVGKVSADAGVETCQSWNDILFAIRKAHSSSLV